MSRLSRRSNLKRKTPLRATARGKHAILAPQYLAWIRFLRCLAFSPDCAWPVEPHHVGHFGRGRDNDYNAVPLCAAHHRLAAQAIHRIGRVQFEREFNLDLATVIADLNSSWKGKAA